MDEKRAHVGEMEAHVGKMEAQLQQWGAKLDALKAKAEQAGAEAKLDARERIDELKAKYQLAQTKLEELRAAGGDKWETIRSGVERAWREVDSAFKKLKD